MEWSDFDWTCRSIRGGLATPVDMGGSVQHPIWSYNVIVTFVFRCSSALSIGLWNFGNGSTYIYLLENRSNKVSLRREAAVP